MQENISNRISNLKNLKSKLFTAAAAAVVVSSAVAPEFKTSNDRDPQANSSRSNYTQTYYYPVIGNGIYNGEKSAGSMGRPLNLLPDFAALRARAYEANLTSDIVKIITGKFFKWVVATGLKMNAEPNETILELEGIKFDATEFKRNVQAYFGAYADSPRSDYSSQGNLHKNAHKLVRTKFLGGDCLVICRLDENFNLTTQIIDGQHVKTPLGTAFEREAVSRGNAIINGIEIEPTGKHVAFYVEKQKFGYHTAVPYSLTFEYERVEAYGKSTGMKMAWMAYGDKHRIDHHRGIPIIAAILDKVQSLDRYTEATVKAAEERAKIVMFVEHGKTSDGRNPFIDHTKRSIGRATPADANEAVASAAKNISVTEDKQVHNLPPDSTLKTVSSQVEINYEPFWRAIFLQLAASVDMPPEVALQQYNSNYSASRAAINGWGFIINIHRNDLVLDFYKPVYDLWLFAHTSKMKVKAKQYLDAVANKDVEVVEAFSAAKFTGPQMPHVDPLKEINAVRAMLGEAYDAIPLITLDRAAEIIDGSDWTENAKKIAVENKTVEELGLKPKPEEKDAANSKDSE